MSDTEEVRVHEAQLALSFVEKIDQELSDIGEVSLIEAGRRVERIKRAVNSALVHLRMAAASDLTVGDGDGWSRL